MIASCIFGSFNMRSIFFVFACKLLVNSSALKELISPPNISISMYGTIKSFIALRTIPETFSAILTASAPLELGPVIAFSGSIDFLGIIEFPDFLGFVVLTPPFIFLTLPPLAGSIHLGGPGLSAHFFVASATPCSDVAARLTMSEIIFNFSVVFSICSSVCGAAIYNYIIIRF